MYVRKSNHKKMARENGEDEAILFCATIISTQKDQRLWEHKTQPPLQLAFHQSAMNGSDHDKKGISKLSEP